MNNENRRAISIKVGNSALRLIQGDITRQTTDAIVNAANSGLMGDGGVDGAIHRAGGPAILEDCKRIVQERGPLPPGQAVITTGGNLPAKYVIHTVGPVWRGGHRGEAQILSNAYANSLALAQEKNIHTISFPSISTGVYRYPVSRAADVALKTVADFIIRSTGIKEVVFVLFDSSTFDGYADVLKDPEKQI